MKRAAAQPAEDERQNRKTTKTTKTLIMFSNDDIDFAFLEQNPSRRRDDMQARLNVLQGASFAPSDSLQMDLVWLAERGALWSDWILEKILYRNNTQDNIHCTAIVDLRNADSAFWSWFNGYNMPSLENEWVIEPLRQAKMHAKPPHALTYIEALLALAQIVPERVEYWTNCLQYDHFDDLQVLEWQRLMTYAMLPVGTRWRCGINTPEHIPKAVTATVKAHLAYYHSESLDGDIRTSWNIHSTVPFADAPKRAAAFAKSKVMSYHCSYAPCRSIKCRIDFTEPFSAWLCTWLAPHRRLWLQPTGVNIRRADNQRFVALGGHCKSPFPWLPVSVVRLDPNQQDIFTAGEAGEAGQAVAETQWRVAGCSSVNRLQSFPMYKKVPSSSDLDTHVLTFASFGLAYIGYLMERFLLNDRENLNTGDCLTTPSVTSSSTSPVFTLPEVIVTLIGEYFN